MNTNLTPVIPQFIDPTTSTVLSSGTLETYVAGTSTLLATYPTNADAIAATNANSTTVTITNGYPKSGGNVIGIFLRPGKQYKFILKDGSGTTLWTVDNISNLTDVIYDGNGNEVLKLSGVSSAVNEITITNAATSSSPIIAATGDDTNIGLKIKTKGTGSLQLLDGSNNELIKLNTNANAVNEITVTNATTTNAPTIAATGDDTNIDLKIDGKGTGKVILGATSTGNIELGNSSTTEITAKADIRLNNKTIIFEGSSDDNFETTFSVTNPTADRTITIPDADVDLTNVIAATQAEQETATATNRTVTPGRQHFHPSAAKHWVLVNISAGTPSVGASYNCSSVTDTATGNWSPNLSTALSSSSYCVHVSGRDDVGATTSVLFTIASSSQYNILYRNNSGGLSDTGTQVTGVIFGDI